MASKNSRPDGELWIEEALFSLVSKRLHELNTKHRWEVRRRHPLYLLYWHDAKDYLSAPELPTDPEKQSKGVFAASMIKLIGVTGMPVDPATEFDDLDDIAIDPAFLSGAVQPMTYRAMLTHFIGAFTPADLSVLGSFLKMAAQHDYVVEGDSPNLDRQRLNAVRQLNSLQHKVLDSYFDGPLVYIHLDASQRTIVEATETLVRRWKKVRNMPERRLQTSKIEQAIAVWDMREGWTGGQYDADREQTFDAIAKSQKASKSTVVNQHRAAFEWIVGMNYSPEVWTAAVAPIKLIRAEGELPRIHRRRYEKLVAATGGAFVPESTLTGNANEYGTSVVEGASTVEDSTDDIDLLLDIKQLINDGKGSDEIQEKLGLNDSSIIDYMRHHV